jgi:hypothetical protein
MEAWVLTAPSWRWGEVYPYALGFGLAILFALTEIAILKDVARLLGR